MYKHAKPNIFISACIEHDACRFDGEMIADEHVKRLKEIANVITACPEMAIGLPSPRESLRLVLEKDTEEIKLISNIQHLDLSEKMTTFSKKYSSNLKSKNIDGFIMKAKSPSCGILGVKLYRGTGKAHTVNAKNAGFFGRVILEDYPNMPIENERRLSNYNIRDQFYIKLYTIASFREVKTDFVYKKLVQFHSANKYLFMSLNQTLMKKMGNIVANRDKIPTSIVLTLYEEELLLLLNKETTRNKRINVLTHIYGYFKKHISQGEKAYYFDVLDDYLNNKVPYSNVLSVLYSWTIRFNEEYLSNQTIFNPYPKELVNVLDSGKSN